MSLSSAPLAAALDWDVDRTVAPGRVAAGNVDDYYVGDDVIAAESDAPVAATLDGETVPLTDLVDD